MGTVHLKRQHLLIIYKNKYKIIFEVSEILKCPNIKTCKKHIQMLIHLYPFNALFKYIIAPITPAIIISI